MEERREDWYRPREILEMILSLKEDLAETQRAVREYNGIREQLNDVCKELIELKSHQRGRASLGESLRVWGGWGVALLLAIIKIIDMYIRIYGGR